MSDYPQSLLSVTLSLVLTSCIGLSAYNPGGLPEPDTDTDTDTDSDTDTDTDSDTDTDPIALTGVAPNYGTSAGGTEVTLTGGPFDNSARVFFGGQEGTVLNALSDSLLVTSPAGTEGLADIKITTATGLGQKNEAFTYWQDANGLTGLIGQFSWYHFVGDYWDSTPADFGGAEILFMVPGTFEYWELFGSAMDTCASNFATTSTAQAYQADYPSVDLITPSGGRIVLSQNSTYPHIYESTDDNVYTHYQQGGTYTLRTVEAGAWPSMEITGALKTPNAFQVTQPAINSTAVPIISSTVPLRWTTGSDGDFVLVQLNLVSGSTLIDSVSCVLRDDGSHTVPSSVWSNWAYDVQANIIIGRASTGTGRLPTNDSDAHAIGIYWLFGAAWTD